VLSDVTFLIFLREQLELKERMILTDDNDWTLEHEQSNTIRYVGGVDISFVKNNETDACAALVVLSYPNLEVHRCENSFSEFFLLQQSD
jgi:deoxyinosine 3'endonuclease (endonuclease V)